MPHMSTTQPRENNTDSNVDTPSPIGALWSSTDRLYSFVMDMTKYWLVLELAQDWACQKTDSTSEVKCLLRDIVPRFRILQYISSARFIHFTGQIMTELCKSLGINQRLHCPSMDHLCNAQEEGQQFPLEMPATDLPHFLAGQYPAQKTWNMPTWTACLPFSVRGAFVGWATSEECTLDTFPKTCCMASWQRDHGWLDAHACAIGKSAKRTWNNATSPSAKTAQMTIQPGDLLPDRAYSEQRRWELLVSLRREQGGRHPNCSPSRHPPSSAQDATKTAIPKLDCTTIQENAIEGNSVDTTPLSRVDTWMPKRVMSIRSTPMRKHKLTHDCYG